MARPIQATISREALRHNYGVAKRTAAHSKVLAVVKANAYGHGVDRAYEALGREVDGFATIELESAVRLRELGFEGPILLMEGFFGPRDLVAMSHYKLAFAVHHEEHLAMMETAKLGDLDVWFKINTGMNRLGFALDAVRPGLERLGASGTAKSVTLMTHFANADGPPGIDDAMQRFEHVTQGYRLPRSLANTAAIFAHPRTHADFTRLGIGLYGATPFADRSAESLGLRPAMTLTSELIAIQSLQPGDCVGYGSTFRCESPMRVGVVACGYADGYPRHAPTGTPVLVGNSRTRTVGRVSMDMITVDLAHVPDAHVGTSVTLWGDGMPIDEVATAAGTVGYELMCGVMPRVRVRLG